jgi:arylsulfatase A-like enzyme
MSTRERAASLCTHLGLRALLVSLFLTLAGCAPQTKAPLRNVILVSLDTLRADRLGIWGHPAGTSPYLDRLARRGVMFQSCIAQASSTLPSHMSLFQACPASLTSDEQPMLAEILRSHGFRTVAFTGGGNVSKVFGFDRGFERYEDGPWGGGLAWSLAEFTAWLDGEGGEPFFAFLHTYDIHVPYDPPSPYDRIYDSDYTGELTGERTRDFCRKIRRVGIYKDIEGDVEPSPQDKRHLGALYDAGIRYTDAMLGKLLAELAERELLDRTLLVVISDHGEEFWDHGSVLHSHTVFQELVHVPLVWRVPGLEGSARVVAETVRNVDVVPTILACFRIEPGESLRGTNLLPRMQGTRGPDLDAVSEMHWLRSLIRSPFKLIEDRESGGTQLYDLDVDPAESSSLVPGLPEQASDLSEILGEELRGGHGGRVRALSGQRQDAELEERLRALGYID